MYDGSNGGVLRLQDDKIHFPFRVRGYHKSRQDDPVNAQGGKGLQYHEGDLQVFDPKGADAPFDPDTILFNEA